MGKLRISVIGVGLGGKTHIQAIRKNPTIELDSIVAPIRYENCKFADGEHVPIFSTVDECIKERIPDAIIIASPNGVHLQQAKLCIEMGIPVLLEKPITANIQEAFELVKLVEAAGAKILVAHHRAHNPIVKKALELIAQGALGSIVTFMGSAQYYKPDHYFIDGSWRMKIGGGPILINLIHEIDMVRRLIGEILSVQAVSSSAIRNFEVEDTVAINFVFKNHALGTFILSDTVVSSKSWEHSSGENPSFPNTTQEDCYLIGGTKGSLSIPTMRLRYYEKDIGRSWWIPLKEKILPVIKEDPVELQLTHFLNIIKNNAKPIVSVEDGYKNLLVIEAIKKSILSKSIVSVGE